MLRHAGRTSDVVFVEETSLTELVVHAGKRIWRVTLANSDTTPQVYRRVTLGVDFDTSVWIITAKSMGVSCIVDSIADKIRLVFELNVRIRGGLALIQQQGTNRLPMPEDSRS